MMPSDEVPVQQARFVLQNGDVIHVQLNPDGRMGEGPYRLKVFSERGQLVTVGSAHNCIEVATNRSLFAEEEALQRVVAERKAEKGA